MERYGNARPGVAVVLLSLILLQGFATFDAIFLSHPVQAPSKLSPPSARPRPGRLSFRYHHSFTRKRRLRLASGSPSQPITFLSHLEAFVETRTLRACQQHVLQCPVIRPAVPSFTPSFRGSGFAPSTRVSLLLWSSAPLKSWLSSHLLRLSWIRV